MKLKNFQTSFPFCFLPQLMFNSLADTPKIKKEIKKKRTFLFGRAITIRGRKRNGAFARYFIPDLEISGQKQTSQ